MVEHEAPPGRAVGLKGLNIPLFLSEYVITRSSGASWQVQGGTHRQLD